MAIKKFARKVSLTFCCVGEGVNVCQHIGKKNGETVLPCQFWHFRFVPESGLFTGHANGQTWDTQWSEYLFWSRTKINHENCFPFHFLPLSLSLCLPCAQLLQQFVCVSNNLVKYYEVSTDDEKNLFRNWFIVFNLIVENGRVSKLKSGMRVETWRPSQWILI